MTIDRAGKLITQRSGRKKYIQHQSSFLIFHINEFTVVPNPFVAAASFDSALLGICNNTVRKDDVWLCQLQATFLLVGVVTVDVLMLLFMLLLSSSSLS